MKIVKLIHNTYKIDNETLLEYIENCDKEDIEPTFEDFLDWWESYSSDFLEDEDSEFESVNDSFKLETAFQKEIKQLNNDRKRIS